MSKHLPPAIIFDWDNTLIDTFPILFEASNLVREKLGYPLWDDAEARAHIRLAGKDSFPALYGARAKEAEGVFYEHIHAHHLNAMQVMPGAEDLLRALHSAGVPLAILSNKRGHILRREVDHLGWSSMFVVINGPDDVGHIGKPNPQGLLQTIHRLGVATDAVQDIWYVGDTENDIKTGQGAGIISVYIENHRMSDPKDIEALAPKFSFQGCWDCLDYLMGLMDSSGKLNKTKE